MSQHLTRRAFLRSLCLTGAGLIAVPLFGKTAEAGQTSRTLPLMGTFVTITVRNCETARAEDAIHSAFDAMRQDEMIFSRHNDAAALAVLNEHGSLDGPPELASLLLEAKAYSRASSGTFDPSVLPVAEAVGRYGEKSIEAQEALSLVGLDAVRISGNSLRLDRQGMGLTLDGIAKGRIVDRASERLSAQGIGTHLIDAGGDIRAAAAKGTRPWHIALRNPLGTTPLGTLSLSNGAIATSGGYESAGKDGRHHLVSPQTANCPAALSSVSVLAPTVAEADALATAMFVMGPRQSLSLASTLPGRHCLLQTAAGTVRTSAHWPVS